MVMTAIECLCQELDRLFEVEGGSGEKIKSALQNYVSNESDWKDYARFCPHKYSRNLVKRTSEYELMVICWDGGQTSPIHNHEGQRCWMAVAEGQLEETYFMFKNTRSTKGEGPLEVSGEPHLIDAGTVGYITDDIALHIIRPTTLRAVSIHLYSRPIPECNVYCPCTGLVTRKKCGFFSENKTICEC